MTKAVLRKGVPRNRQRTSCAEKNDNLGWVDGFSFDYDGLKFGFRTNQPEMLSKLRGIMPSSGIPASDSEVDVLFSLLIGTASARKGVKNFHIAYEGWSRIARSLDLDAVIQTLSAYARVQFAGMSKQRTFVNCPLLSWNGKGLLVCGDSRSTNRQLVQALVTHGAEILCQDYTGIGEAGSLWSLDQVDDVKIKPKAIIYATYNDRGGWRPSKISGSQSALELVSRAHNMRINPGPTMARLTDLAFRIEAYRGVYRNPEKVIPFLQNI